MIVSITGFFGFKSINEIKLAAIESSKEEAKKFLNDEEGEFHKRSREIIRSEVDITIKRLEILKVDNVRSIVDNETERLNVELQNLKVRIEQCCPKNKVKDKTNSTQFTQPPTENQSDEDDELFSNEFNVKKQ